MTTDYIPRYAPHSFYEFPETRGSDRCCHYDFGYSICGLPASNEVHERRRTSDRRRKNSDRRK